MKRRVLFLCTGNSARSQMAEGLLRHMAGDSYDVYSAGTHPMGLHPGAAAAMQELGIDISAQQSKSIGEFTEQAFDYVITVCDRAKESCPCWPQTARLVHWSFEDPASAAGPPDEQRHAFGTVRDQITARIEEFLSTGLKGSDAPDSSKPTSDDENSPASSTMSLAP